MSKDFELILKDFVLALQVCLGVWQFTKLTPVGALIKGVVSWLLRPFGLSETYSRLQIFDGRVFKKVDCFVLQPEIPSARRGNVELGSQDRLQLHVTYLGKRSLLERRGNMLFVDGKMCYYIIPTVWAELQFLESVTESGSFVERAIRTGALTADDFAGVAVNDIAAAGNAALSAAAAATIANPADLSAALHGGAARSLARQRSSVVLKGHREFWEEVSTGGIMSLDEVLDGLILHNQHLSLPLADSWLLPVDLSVSEEKLLKILNLFALFLQTKKEMVHWLIPTSLSIISALLEFSTPLRVWLYTNINLLFCSIMHSMCDLLPRPWRRQVYSLGKWVENLKPTNDIQRKIQRGTIRAIIAGGAKIDRRGASLAEEENVAEEEDVISNNFHCNSIGARMTCTYFVSENRCHIDAPTVSRFTVECRSMEEYRCLITLVRCMANNGCGSLKSCGSHNEVSVRGFRESVLCFVKSGFGSLKSCGSHNEVSVRGFRESVLCYVKSGFPPVYELQLENVVLI